MSAYSTYQSPLRPLRDLGLNITNFSKENLHLERKKLLLELQMAEDQALHFGDKSFTKNDILLIFEELKNVSNFDFHSAISHHSELLEFLENQKVNKRMKDVKSLFDAIPNQKDEFVRFISPYLANSIDLLFIEVLEKKNFIQIQNVELLFQLLLPEDVPFAFQKFYDFCQNLDFELKRLSGKYTLSDEGKEVFRGSGGAIFPRGDVLFLCYRPFYNLTNFVDEHFPDTADTVARAIIEFTNLSQNGVGRRDSLLKISDQARALKCSHVLEDIIVKNRARFELNIEESSSGPDPIGVLKIFVFFSLAAFFFYKSCASDDSNRSLSNEEFYEQVRQQGGRTSSSNRTPIGSKFTQAGFIEVHSKVNRLVNSGSFTENNGQQIATPCILSRYMNHDGGEKFTIYNRTNSDMLLVVCSAPFLYSYFLKQEQYTDFELGENAQLFLYSGNDWQSDACIQTKVDLLTPITISGRFKKTSKKDLDLLKKRYDLGNAKSNNFTIKEVNSTYVLFRGNRKVKYSF